MIKVLSIIATILLFSGFQSSTPVSPSETPTPTQGQTSASGDPSPKFSLTSPDGTTVKFDPSQNPDN
ncbi:MAG: hypothetical protein WC423_05505, partial [Vulcanimicrobiota bacterium]